jgi:hypothetical protein
LNKIWPPFLSWLSILLLSVVSCVVYGILHDQVTARICVEYFTVGHPPVFRTEDPTLLAFGWGTIATWWVGVFLGIPLATAARLGSRPKRSAISLIRPIAAMSVCVGFFALVAGFAGYFFASKGWVFLYPPLAFQIPQEKHVPFIVDLFAHNASYLGGFLGGIVLAAWVWWTRIRMEIASRKESGQERSDSISH